jgi:hypothetical protein
MVRPCLPCPTLYAAGGHGTVIGASNMCPVPSCLCLYGAASRLPIHCSAGTHPRLAASAPHRGVLSTAVPCRRVVDNKEGH